MVGDFNRTGVLEPNYLVLFYFMYSPFFEPGSRNSEVFDDRRDMDRWIRVVSTYQSFQAELKKKPGVEYVLWSDPEDQNIMVEGPNGTPERSSLYIIRKQRRHDEKSVTPMAYYWCMGIKIFQAPCAANVITARILDLSAALNKSFEKMSQLSVFSTSYGRTWEKPGQKTNKKGAAELGRLSKEGTPVPTQDTAASDRSGLPPQMANGDDEGDARTLAQALQLTTRFANEYADETKLVGDPGNFRFNKDRLQPATASLASASQRRDVSRGVTPLHGSTPR